MVCDKSQSSKSSFVSAVSKTLIGKVTTSDFLFAASITTFLFDFSLIITNVENLMKKIIF